MTSDGPVWNRARWIRAIALVFVGQVFFAWALAEHSNHPIRATKPLAPVALVVDPSVNQRIAASPEVIGSTLFALVSPQGFSGTAWLKSQPRQNALTEWEEPEFYLPPNPARLGTTFEHYITTNAPKLSTAATFPVAQMDPVDLPAARLPAQSTFRITGDLAARKQSHEFFVPQWPLAGTLDNTIVSVAVDASGEVFSTAVITSSGLAAADAKAVELVGQMHFSPSPQRRPASPIGADLTWGRVIFRWQTIAPPAAATAPPP